MECRDFLRHLRSFVRGELPEPAFGRMVEHEAGCADCRALAAELSAQLGEPELVSLSAADRAGEQDVIRARTEGRDCDWIGLRLAEALEDVLDPAATSLVREHVADCSRCQRMRDALQALPDFYGTLPVLRADRDFTRAVMDRTIGPRPRFLDVIRAIWRRPEAVWEAAAVCALLAAVVFGGRLPDFQSVSGRIQEVAEARMPDLGETIHNESGARFPAVRQATEKVRNGWSRVEGTAAAVSDWTQRVRGDLREGDYPSLLEDMREVLEPIGLYPDHNEPMDANSAAPDANGTLTAPEGDENERQP